MYRAKYQIWVALILLAIVIRVAPSVYSSLFEEDKTVYVSVEGIQNPLLVEKLNGLSKNHYYFKTVLNKSGMSEVILRGSSEEELDGYTKISDVMTSPIVLFAPQTASKEGSGFVIADKQRTYSPTYKEWNSIFQGLISDKTWKDIGISNKVAEGKIKLMIPIENSVYYTAVVKAIYMSLNQGTELNSDDVVRLQPTVDLILSKCTKVEDLGQEIYDIYKGKSSKKGFLAIGPEFIMNNNAAFEYNGDKEWMPIYNNNMVEISVDMFVKGEEEFVEDMKEVLSSKKIGERTSMRSTFRGYNLANNLSDFDFAPETITVGYITKSADSLIEDLYRSNIPVYSFDTSENEESSNETSIETEVEETKVEDTSVTETIENTSSDVDTEGVVSNQQTEQVLDENSEQKAEEPKKEVTFNNELKPGDVGETSENTSATENVEEEDSRLSFFDIALIVILVIIGLLFLFCLLALIF